MFKETLPTFVSIDPEIFNQSTEKDKPHIAAKNDTRFKVQAEIMNSFNNLNF